MPRIKRTKDEIKRDIEQQEKTCCVCSIRKSFSCFYNFKNKSDGKSYRCKQCDDEARKKWKELNVEAAKYSSRRNNLKAKYGIDIDDYIKMLEKQNYRCAICCASSNNVKGKTRKLWNFAVDHCHKTKQIRGLLCNSCNRAIGLLQDDVTILRKAADYLAKHDSYVN